MNIDQITDYVELSPVATKEVFYSLIKNTSPATLKATVRNAETYINALNDGATNDYAVYLNRIDLDTFLAFSREYNVQQKETWQYKLLIAPFKGSWIRLIAHLYDLNAEQLVKWDKESDSSYSDVGEGILLAGLAIIIYMEEN
jgi:hypothetical protein